ncbi:MAG: hypothetical protein IJW37_10275 [Lachnospiraceae bacterium]|nr:hypothetical protein [Lachnospiraceae bacterium]
MNVIVSDEFVSIDGDMSDAGDMGYMEDMYGTEQQVSKTDELLSSWLFVGGVTAAVLALGIAVGLLSAKRKIKKGIDLYED